MALQAKIAADVERPDGQAAKITMIHTQSAVLIAGDDDQICVNRHRRRSIAASQIENLLSRAGRFDTVRSFQPVGFGLRLQSHPSKQDTRNETGPRKFAPKAIEGSSHGQPPATTLTISSRSPAAN